jgi:nickel-type superoxide dismutase maturation protease
MTSPSRSPRRRWLKPVYRALVAGDSMRPALRPGERLLAVAVPTRFLRPGDVVIACDPRAPERVLVKRAAAISADGVILVGDNPAASTDSRTLGPVPRDLVLGRAVLRYAPQARAGWLRRTVPASAPVCAPPSMNTSPFTSVVR